MGNKDKKTKKRDAESVAAVIDVEAGAPGDNLGHDEADSAGATPPGTEAAAVNTFVFPETSRKKGRRRGWIIAVVIIVVLLLVLALVRGLRLSKTVAGSNTFSTYTVERGDITVTLSGSGTLQPADSYTVTSLVSGDIISAPFEEGNVVGKDQTLYTIDSSDINTSIEQAENSLSDSQYKYSITLGQLEDLRLKAGGTGIVAALNVDPGDTVQAGQAVAVIRNSDVMRLTVLFQRETAESFQVGQSADVTLNNNFETFPGTVSEISKVDQVLPGSIIAREVTIDVANPGAIAPDDTAYVTISGSAGIESGTFVYSYEENITATVSGTVSNIHVAEGGHVKMGEVIITLQSDTVDQQVQSAMSAVESAQLSLESQLNKLDSYTITSPISGTIVEKVYKEGDTLNTGGTVLCTIYDLSHLTLTLNIDELDIKKVQTGQAVSLMAAAAEGREYVGTVTKINIKGTTKNGVTSYPVTIEIDETEGLLPGMNVDAEITVNAMQNVLKVPVGAVVRGSFVLLKTDNNNEQAESGVPVGYSYTEVTLGPSNDTDIVITSGLTEGDVVAVMDNTPESYDFNMFARPRQTVNATSGDSGGATQQAQSDSAGASE